MDSPPSATDRGFWANAADEVARRRYRELVDTLDEGVYQLDPDGHFVAVNDALVAMTGYPRDELIGEHFSALFAPDGVERLEREADRGRESADVDVSIRTARGGAIPCVVRVDPVLTGDDGRGIVGVVRHDTEAESAPSASSVPNGVLRTIINETEGAAFVLDDGFDVVWADATIGRYFGVDPVELVGRDKRQVVHETLKERVEDPERFAELVLATYDDNSYIEEFECRVTPGRNREERWLKHWSKPITCGQYAGGRIECYTDVSDRKQSDDARKQIEERFSSLVDAVTDYAIFRLHPDGTVASWNEGAKNIKGYEAEEILGEHISTFYTQEDRAAGVPERNLERACEEGSVEDEGWRVRKDGSRFWANVTITAIEDEDGTRRGFLKVTRDMTERHQHQQQLESELQRILGRISDAFFAVDEDFRFTHVNERATELLDRSRMDLLGESIWDVLDDTSAVDAVQGSFDTAMNCQESVSIEFYHDTLDFWAEAHLYPSDTGISVYFRDVTERRERQRKLRERERELEEYKEYTDDILNALDDLFYVVDKEGYYRRWNESLRTVTGYSDDEIASMEPLGLIAEEERERVASHLAEVLETGDTRVEATLLTKEGERVPMEFVASAVETPDGERVVAGIGRDITERKRRQQQLEESNERLEQFAYAASHDLQEPLRMVSSYLQLIERRYADALDEDGQEFLEFAVDGADRMRDMIDGLLAYSRIESQGASFEPVELNDVVADARENLQMMCDEHDADISVESLPCVEGDRGQLRQLFQNLLENAMAYSGDEPPRIHVSAERKGEEWVVSVRDEGIGIDPDDAGRIFEVFQSLEGPGEEGSGIGLALCKRIVERHGGDIWVDSSLGEGATFSFTLSAPGDDDE